MTDRLHSCKESSDGRHQFVDAMPSDRPGVIALQVREDCRWCGRRRRPSVYGRIPRAGWNVPAFDPDAHLGTVGGE